MGSALLAIDVGNSNTLAGVFQGDELLHEWRISTERSATADELAASHDQILRLRGEGEAGCAEQQRRQAKFGDSSATHQAVSFCCVGSGHGARLCASRRVIPS